jgi:hypothetical protein
MGRTRIDRETTGSGESTPALDHAWAATRPGGLSDEAFERIWAEVQRKYDAGPARLSILTAPAVRTRRGIILVAFGVAQLAAAVLVAAWVLNRPGTATDRSGVVQVETKPDLRPVVVARHDVDADETLILRIDDGTWSEERRPGPETIPALAMNDLPASTPSDMLGYLESLSK